MGTVAGPELSTRWGLEPENISDLSFKNNASEVFEEEQSTKTLANTLPEVPHHQGCLYEGEQDQEVAPPTHLPPSLSATLPSLSASLTELRLPHSHLTSLPPSLASLPLLTCLDLSHNLLDSSALPAALAAAPALRTLHLHANLLTETPRWLEGLTRCIRLTLGDNPYSGLPLLPPGLGVRPAGRRLKHLHLDSAGLKELPAPVLQCRDLHSLVLSSTSSATAPNRMWRLPESLPSLLPSLQLLAASSVSLSSLPSHLGGLSHLTTLLLPHNSLSWLPATFSLLTSLQYCDVSDNLLLLFPDLSTLPHLRHLLASGNRIAELPSSLPTSLTTLDLWTNQVAALPALPPALERADLGANMMSLEEVEEAIPGYFAMQARLWGWRGEEGEWGVQAEERSSRGEAFTFTHPEVEEEREGLRKFHLNNTDDDIYETMGCDVFDTTDLDALSLEEEKVLEVDEVKEDEGDAVKDIVEEEEKVEEEDGDDEDEDEWGWEWAPCPPLPDRRRPFFCPADDHPKTVNRGVLVEWDAWRGRRSAGGGLRAGANQPRARRDGGEEGQFLDA